MKIFNVFYELLYLPLAFVANALWLIVKLPVLATLWVLAVIFTIVIWMFHVLFLLLLTIVLYGIYCGVLFLILKAIADRIPDAQKYLGEMILVAAVLALLATGKALQILLQKPFFKAWRKRIRHPIDELSPDSLYRKWKRRRFFARMDKNLARLEASNSKGRTR